MLKSVFDIYKKSNGMMFVILDFRGFLVYDIFLISFYLFNDF